MTDSCDSLTDCSPMTTLLTMRAMYWRFFPPGAFRLSAGDEGIAFPLEMVSEATEKFLLMRTTGFCVGLLIFLSSGSSSSSRSPSGVLTDSCVSMGLGASMAGPASLLSLRDSG